MEIYCQLEYNKGHETPWEPRTTGKAAPASCPFVQDGQEPASHSTRFECFCKFSVPLASGLPRERGSLPKPQPTPGRPAMLTQDQKKQLVQVLLNGPLAAGYRTDLWTLNRVAKAIDQQFGVQYHPSHVWKLLVGLGWSCQKPERRALPRNEEEIAHGSGIVGPIEKNAERRGGHLVFLDESGFLLIPNVTRTFPEGINAPLLPPLQTRSYFGLQFAGRIAETEAFGSLPSISSSESPGSGYPRISQAFASPSSRPRCSIMGPWSHPLAERG